MLVLGTWLLVRFAHWVGSRRRAWIDTQIRRQIESGLVASESLKRSRAVSEAVEWAVVALASFIVAIVALDRLGIPLTTLVAPATVIGIGLGFGAQQMVGDLLGRVLPAHRAPVRFRGCDPPVGARTSDECDRDGRGAHPCG